MGTFSLLKGPSWLKTTGAGSVGSVGAVVGSVGSTVGLVGGMVGSGALLLHATIEKAMHKAEIIEHIRFIGFSFQEF